MDRPSPAHSPENSSRWANAIVHAGMFLTGMLTTLLGPLLPVLSARWSLADAQAGYFFTAQFAGSMTGAVLTGLLLPRRGFRFALVLGFALTAAGALVLGVGNWAVGLLSVYGYGIGLGFTIACTNLWVSESNPGRRAAAVSILNFAWGVGAVVCPFVFAVLHRAGQSYALLYALAAAFVLVAVLFAMIAFPDPKREVEAENPAAPRPGVWSIRFGPALGALFFLYVGTENALGGWVAFYAKRVSAGPGTLWVIAPSFFWGTLLVGRALAPAVLRHVTEARIVLGGLVLATLGGVALLGATTLAAVLACASLAGFGLSAIFPILVAWISHTFGEAASRLAGRMFAMGAFGGATLPWLVGYLSTQFGGLKAGLVAPLLGSVAMLALLLSTPPPVARRTSPSGHTNA
ncbi:MAG: MFS transporter [Acidobacteria bacterium]|nr:MFS transporter [Acidobacteriota bacterium]MBI3663980.1 MFS transporter [Acidobacteriota bacterium]